MTGFGVSGVNEIVLEVLDLERSIDFYVGCLGLPLYERSDERVWVLAGRSRIGLWRPQVGIADGRGGVHVHYALHIDEADYADAKRVLPALERRTGRLLVNGFGTGVEVGHAMVHGGPFPSTADGRSTSVGSLAINRFLRPVSYQDLPDALLPDALKTDNPLGLNRRIDGKLQLAE